MKDESPVVREEDRSWRTPLANAWYAARHLKARAECKVLGHKQNLSNIGFGFGHLDYWCARCGIRIASIPLADMDEEEVSAVAGLGGGHLMLQSRHQTMVEP